ncbi:Golgi pH regulator B [Chytriomyces hyalinus]|nr:Golgi pH regulator B [Chytriomyces hyalinus]
MESVTALCIAAASLPFLLGAGRIACGYVVASADVTRTADPRAHVLFSVSFALSCLVFETLLIDILALIPAKAANLLWVIVLVSNLVCVLVVLPAAVGLITCPSWVANTHRYLFAMIAWLSFIIIFMRITAPTGTASTTYFSAVTGLFSIHQNITRISGIGVALMAILSGFGAVFTPYTTLLVFVKNIDDGLVAEKECELERTQDAVLEKRRRVMELQEHRNRSGSSRSSVSGETAGVGGFMRRVIGGVKSGILGNDELLSLKNELRALESLLQTLNRDLEELQYERSLINLVFHRHGGTDPITLGIDLAIKAMASSENNPGAESSSPTIDVEASAQQLSFLFVGVLVASSVRALVIQFSKVFRMIAGNASNIADVIILFFAQIMNMYCLSLVLMMRISLPPKYSAIISNVLGDVQFQFYQRWFDSIFLVSALASFVFLYALSDDASAPLSTLSTQRSGFMETPSSRASSVLFSSSSRTGSAASMEGLLGKKGS